MPGVFARPRGFGSGFHSGRVRRKGSLPLESAKVFCYNNDNIRHPPARRSPAIYARIILGKG